MEEILCQGTENTLKGGHRTTAVEFKRSSKGEALFGVHPLGCPFLLQQPNASVVLSRKEFSETMNELMKTYTDCLLQRSAVIH
jgi:hypothetical protein